MDSGFLQIDKEGRRRLTPEGEAMLSQEGDPCCCEPGGGMVGCATAANDGLPYDGVIQDGTGICDECGTDRILFEADDVNHPLFNVALPEGSGLADNWITGPNYTPIGWYVSTANLTTCGCVMSRVNGVPDSDTLFEIDDGEGCALRHADEGCKWGPYGTPGPGNLHWKMIVESEDGRCDLNIGDGEFMAESSAIEWRMEKTGGKFTLEGIVPWIENNPLRIFLATAEGDPKDGCRTVTFTNEYKDLGDTCDPWEGNDLYPIIGREGTVIVRRCCWPSRSPRS